MFKIDIKNEITQMTYSAQFDTESEMTFWRNEQVKAESWGKCERDSLSDEGHPERVISTRIEPAVEDRPSYTVYRIKSDYVIIVVDLSQDPTWLLAECQRLRAAEYPALEDYMDAKVKQASSDAAIVAAGVAQEKEYLDACLAVKAKYPKP